MKILFTIRSLTGGGAERVVSVLSGLLADVGEDVHIITYKTSERDYSISEKVQIHEMPQRKDSTITKGMRIFDMRKIIKEIQPDVIIPFVGTVLYVSWLAITGMKIPFVLTIRNNPWTMPEKRLLRNFRDYLAKKSCAILVQNEEQSEYFSADLRKKCFVVPNPLSSKFIDNHKEIYSRKISKIIAVGRLHEQKNYPLLLKAMVDITKIKSEITLDIFGEGNQKKYLEGLVDEYGLANYVFLRGRSQSIEKQLQVADMFVMTSDYEGMPNALIGILPSQTSAGREYLGFYFATFGPNLFLHTVLAYIASRKNKIKFKSWILIEVINVWFYKMTDTLAVFVVINASIILYYLLNIEKIKQFLFDRDFPRRILEIFPFFSAIATIVAQYFYIAHYNEPAFVAINAAFSNRPYFGKIALETYGVSLFGQPMLFAKEGVFFLSGDAYAGAIIPMQVIMPTLLFIGLTNIMGIQMLVPLGKEKVVLYSEIAGMIGDIILNALLIPKMASTGAAIGTLAAEIAVFIVQYVALRGIIKEAYRQVHYVAIGSSVLAGGVLAVLIKRMQWGSFMTLCASAIVFFGVYFLILTIAKESLVIEIENQLLGRIIKKK